MRYLFLAIILLSCSFTDLTSQQIDKEKLAQDLEQILRNLEGSYTYFDQKGIDINCLREKYSGKIRTINNKEEKVLFFEYLLDEFYDSHLILNTNTTSSYRLFPPIYAKSTNGKFIISNVWTSQLQPLDTDIIGAEIISFNNVRFQDKILDFPTLCNEKTDSKISEWIANKVLAGKYNEPRILGLKLKSGQLVNYDLDELKFQDPDGLIQSSIVDGIGIIRLNNSLGNDKLINDFDKALDSLAFTEGLIIDLRNTVSGGNSYEARGLMSRFISEPLPYQKHSFAEKAGHNPDQNPIIQRTWLEFVEPRGQHYKKPVVILVGRWTGSMGEGLAIGMDGMERASIVGSEMERLAGEVSGYSLPNQNFGYQLSFAKLFHLDGTPREEFIPEHYIRRSTALKDEVLEEGIKIMQSIIKGY